MNHSFIGLYLGLLVALLAVTLGFILNQVLKTRRTEGSLSRLQSKLRDRPGTAQEHFELGSIFLSKKLYAQAATQLQKALKSAEREKEEAIAPIYNALGYACFAQQQYDLAIRHYKTALKTDPTYTTALNNLGHAYERKNLTSQALEAYEQVLATEPNNTTAKKRAASLRKRLVVT
jgi:tetratricopeptide (TPR) repeat protein